MAFSEERMEFENSELLIRQLALGSEFAFREIMRLYFPFILAFSRRIVENDAAAEDITSETFITLWNQRDKFDSLLSLKAFLFTTSRNRCLNELRQHQRATKRHEIYSDAHQQTAIDDHIIRTEAMMLIVQTSNGLPEKMRKVFEMSFLEGLPNRDIARLLNLSTNTIKAQKARALELIREELSRNELLTLALLAILADFNR